jgi:hypothetical protein
VCGVGRAAWACEEGNAGIGRADGVRRDERGGVACEYTQDHILALVAPRFGYKGGE